MRLHRNQCTTLIAVAAALFGPMRARAAGSVAARGRVDGGLAGRVDGRAAEPAAAEAVSTEPAAAEAVSTGPVAAEPLPAAAPRSAVQVRKTPETLLEKATEALAIGDRDLARTLYRRLRQRFPMSSERSSWQSCSA